MAVGREVPLRLLCSTALWVVLTRSVLAQSTPAQPQPDAIAEVVVTAQKRSENLQRVPVAVQALDQAVLTQHQVQSFADYAKLLPSLSFDTLGPGQAQIYFRGISNGDRLATGALPSVGVYLDEQPVTTVGQSLDVHVYDIARIEALAGPQGTLYGASSEAGTVRIITNKPDPAKFDAGMDLTGSTVTHGDQGGTAEGFVNVPLAHDVAVRLVSFYERDPGYIDNVLSDDQVYPTSGVARSNAGLTRRDINAVDTYGGRALLGARLGDWKVTPSVMFQELKQDGSAAYRPATGYLSNTRFFDEYYHDRWVQAALTIEGRAGPVDLTYAGAGLDRTTQYVSDYSDYSYFYDTYYSLTPENFGDNFFNNNGELINPAQLQTGRQHYTKMSHELRASLPKTYGFQIVGGLFYQRQTDDWTNLYIVPGLADSQSVTGLPGVNYANIQTRVDRDYAAFAQASYDITPTLTLTAGLRGYRYDNNVVGFFGYNAQRSAVGEATCIPGTIGTAGHDRPCDNIDAKATGDGFRHKLSLSWQVDPARMIYATWSTGFRPGGINRRSNAPPYQAEALTNYEAGWKTEWFGRRLRVNGDVFLEDLSEAQFPVTSDQNGIEDIVNAGRARSEGVEGQVEVAPRHGLTLSASAAFIDARLRTDLCQYAVPGNDCSQPSAAGNANSLTAPAGSRFPSTPRIKATTTARYEFKVGDYQAHVQGAAFYQGDERATLVAADQPLLGRQPAYATLDASAGMGRGHWSLELQVANLLDQRAQAYRYATCTISVCGQDSIQVIPVTPRLASLRLAWRN